MTTIVFVGGAGRSGTTFLAHALSRFGNISAGVESQWVYELIRADLEPSKWVDFSRNHWKIRTSPRQPDSTQWAKLEEIAAEDDVGVFCSSLLRLLAEDDVDFIIDHTPSNIINHSALREAFPNAKFIHIVRDGRAVYASLKKVKWGPNGPYAAADYWLRAIAHGLLAEQILDSNVFQRVHYETLIEQPQELDRLADWIIGDKAMLKSISGDVSEDDLASIKDLPKYTQKQHALVNKPPDPSRINAWGKDLSQKEIAAFEQRTYTLLTYFNYHLKYYPQVNPGRSYQAISQIVELTMGLAINPIRNAIRTRGEQYRKS